MTLPEMSELNAIDGEAGRIAAMAFEPDALAILQERRVAVFGTLLGAGGPGLACVWYGIDGGDLIISTPAGRRKDKNIRADPRVSLIVDASDYSMPPGTLGYKGVEVRGEAIMEDDDDGSLRRKIVGRYLDPIPPEFEARFTAQERAIIRIRPSKVRVWDYTNGRR